MSEVAGDTTKAALIELVCPESVFNPRLTDLFKALVVIRSPTHSIQIVRNDRMIGAWKHEKIDRDVSGVTRSRAHTETDLSSVVSVFFQILHVPGDDVRPGVETFWSSSRPVSGGFRITRAVAQEQNERKC